MSKSNKKIKLSVIILTKNEEKNIEACLKSCEGLGETLVIDAESTDQTVNIAKHYTSHIIINPFQNFKSQREFGASKASGEWVLFVDADEQVSPDLKKEILSFIDQDRYTLLEIPRQNIFLGKHIKYSGWDPNFVKRLVKKSTMIFNKQIVHESIDTTGETMILSHQNAYLTHYTCQDLTQYINKINHYTSLEVVYYANQEKHPFKLTVMGVIFRALGMFTQTIFSYKGYKDGYRGFIIAGLNAMSSFLLMIKLWEKTKKDV